MMETILGKMEKTITEGKSADEIQNADLNKEFDEQYGNGFVKPGDFSIFLKIVLLKGDSSN